MNLGDRVKKVRKDLQLTQQEFSERLGMKRNSIAQIESGRNTSNQTLCAICREFNVSETWLRTGKGEPFLEKNKENILEVAVQQLLSGESSEFKTRLIKILATLGSREWSILEDYALKLVQDKPILNSEREVDEFAARLEALERKNETLERESEQTRRENTELRQRLEAMEQEDALLNAWNYSNTG